MRMGALLLAIAVITSEVACGRTPAPGVPTEPAAATTPVIDAGVADAEAPDAAPPPVTYNLRLVEPPAGTAALPDPHQVAARLFIVSDTQLHYLFGKRTFAQSPFADRMSFEVAVRPAALDDGSDLILGAFLDDWKARWPQASLVFLGDAADLSCTQEMDRFVGVMRDHGADRFLAVTANHDGFFVGNFTSKKDMGGQLAVTDMPDDWTRACAEPGSFDDHRLTKGRAVERLLSVLPPGPLWATSAAHQGFHGPDDYRKVHLTYARPLGGGDAGAPPVWGLFLDTVDYRDFDLHASEGAGRMGAVSRQQMRFLDRAAFEASALAPIGQTRFLLFGHHPIDELEPSSRKRLLAFLDARPDILAYVAAHTHKPEELSIALPSGRRVPEIVAGSTTDSPNAGLVLEVQVNGSESSVARWRTMLDTEGLCADVPPLPPTASGYTGYRIARDGVPDVNVGTLDKLMFAVGLSELEQQRVVQMLGALLIENELVRSWAELYLGDGAAKDPELERIASRRYAAGSDLRALTPWLQGKARPGQQSAYDAWWDPVGARVVRVAALGFHRFGPHAAHFRALRETRRNNPRYFLCHAAHAAAAESHHARRRGKILYIR